MRRDIRLLLVHSAALGLVLVTTGATSGQGPLEKLEKRLFGEKKPADPLPAPPSVGDPAPKPNVTLDPPAKSEPGYLGATCDDTGLGGKGVAVLSVRGGGPADKAGLKPGDRIVVADHRTISKLEDLGRALSPHPAGAEVEFEVSRGGMREIVKVVLGVRPAAIPEAGELPPELAPADGGRATLGLHVGPITAAAKELYRITAKKGALVDGITPNSPADRAGIPLGAVIVALGEVPVDSPEDLRGLVAAARPGDELELSYYQADTLHRKKVRLAPPAGSVLVPGAAPAPQPSPAAGGILGRRDDRRATEERPVIRALGKALDKIGEERGRPAGPGELTTQVETLTAQIELLQRQNEELARRIKQLEQQLSKEKP